MERRNDPKARPWAGLLETLNHPVRLRLALASAMLAAWYGAVYRPMTARIAEASSRLAEDRERLGLLRTIDDLTREEGRYRGRLPSRGDRNAWVRFLMDEIANRPLKLASLDPQTAVNVGSHRAEVARVIVEGPYAELESFLRWLEAGPGLIRIDSIEIATRNATTGAVPRGTYTMRLIVMGVVG